MKAYELYFISDAFGDELYPDDCMKIYTYLSSNGKINFNPKNLSSYYRKFCGDKYCAGWMYINEDILDEFAYWLSNQEI